MGHLRLPHKRFTATRRQHKPSALCPAPSAGLRSWRLSGQAGHTGAGPECSSSP